eukprot:TRINITY_DN14267_c0_g1_i1.p1 TRINITY_DN14267_c0_g1~~TRINITY_DN14267_c0_g1_i1.p1  ORF type:complete len:839 (-),score=222.19 TRINITY_DN14267_c0_g1_i1:117-2399(-)
MAGHTVVVGQLIRALADPNAIAQDGRTALHRAAFHGWKPVVDLLLNHGADPFIKDSDGRKPIDLARNGHIKDLIEGCDIEKVHAAQEERRQKLALRPTPEPDLDDEEEKPKFAPPSRAEQEAAAAAKAKAAEEEKARKKAELQAKAEAEREEKYRKAMAALREERGEDGEFDETAYERAQLEASKLAVPRIALEGASEKRLNGTYQAAFASPDRVEFEKIGDRQCQIFWSQWHDEWRMLIADFKLGSTLYRHKHRPNVKYDEHHGIPKDGWTKWFGQDPIPTVRYLAEDEPDYVPPVEVEEEATPEEEEPAKGAEAQKDKKEYLEIHSSLDIVKQADDGAATRNASAPNAKKINVSLREGDGQIIETSEGLFSADEVPVTEVVTEVADPKDAMAAKWLEDTGDAPEVPATVDAIQAAKAAASELFNEEKVDDARQATTAALRAMRKLLAMTHGEGVDGASQEELDALLGVLHSNRSLLLTQQILAKDPKVLSFGEDAAWRLVIFDADEALKVNPGNFKASFRRAKALFELGDLDEALADATKVVDHYSRNSSTSNPEAAALREKILEAVKKERRKWGDKGGPRWNAATNQDQGLITEISSSGGPDYSFSSAFSPITSATKSASSASRVVTNSSSSRPVAAPRNGSDVEKILLSTAKGDNARQLAYVKEHLSAENLRKFYRRAPLGPDLLAIVIRILSELAQEDVSAARERLGALAAAPSARTQTAMFDPEEKAALNRLLSKVGSEAAAAWEEPSGTEGGA